MAFDASLLYNNQFGNIGELGAKLLMQQRQIDADNEMKARALASQMGSPESQLKKQEAIGEMAFSKLLSGQPLDDNEKVQANMFALRQQKPTFDPITGRSVMAGSQWADILRGAGYDIQSPNPMASIPKTPSSGVPSLYDMLGKNGMVDIGGATIPMMQASELGQPAMNKGITPPMAPSDNPAAQQKAIEGAIAADLGVQSAGLEARAKETGKAEGENLAKIPEFKSLLLTVDRADELSKKIKGGYFNRQGEKVSEYLNMPTESSEARSRYGQQIGNILVGIKSFARKAGEGALSDKDREDLNALNVDKNNSIETQRGQLAEVSIIVKNMLQSKGISVPSEYDNIIKRFDDSSKETQPGPGKMRIISVE